MKRFEIRKVKRTLRCTNYRTAVPRGAATKEALQMRMADVYGFAEIIEYNWHTCIAYLILPRQ